MFNIKEYRKEYYQTHKKNFWMVLKNIEKRDIYIGENLNG